MKTKQYDANGPVDRRETLLSVDVNLPNYCVI